MKDNKRPERDFRLDEDVLPICYYTDRRPRRWVLKKKKWLGRDFKLDEEILPKLVCWPEGKLEPSEMREIFDKTNRFIDFDQTIAWEGGTFPKDKLCGKPTAEFLAEEPYILQTWNPDGSVRFFTELYPEFPKPLLIILVPAFNSGRSVHDYNLGKNFAALGLTGKTIIDDLHPGRVHAPGCTLIHPDK